MAKRLIATYTRVSTARQEEEQTIRTQQVTLAEEAKRNEYIVVREYSDEGWSGDTLARPALDQLRNDAKLKLFDSVLIYDPDRLARRYSYQELVMDELKEAGVEVLFVTVSTPKNAEDKILYGVRGLFAEYERAKISERFRLGKVRKIKDGNLLVSVPLFGYTYVPKHDGNQGHYVVNEAEASIVRQIFHWVADYQLTLRAVVRKLQELGIRPRNSKRGVWSTSTLSTMLRNKAYIGEARWGSSYAVVPENPLRLEKYRKIKKSSRRVRPESEWYTVSVPAIIDAALFERTRGQVDKNFEMCERNTKNEYLLSKLVWCTCGSRRAGEGPQHGKHLYYRCSDRVKNFPLPSTCKEPSINARILDEMVWEKIVELMTSPVLMLEHLDRWIISQKQGTSEHLDIRSLQEEIEKLRKEEDRFNKAYGQGAFTIEQLQQYTQPLKGSIHELQTKAATYKQQRMIEKERAVPEKSQIEQFAKAALRKLRDLSFQQKKAIVVNVVDKIVGTRQHVTVYGSIPIDEDVKFFTNHRDGQNARNNSRVVNSSLALSYSVKIIIQQANS